jgi:hypothetical protein
LHAFCVSLRAITVLADERQTQGKLKREAEDDRREQHASEECAGSCPGDKKKRPNLFRFGLSRARNRNFTQLTHLYRVFEMALNSKE